MGNCLKQNVVACADICIVYDKLIIALDRRCGCASIWHNDACMARNGLPCKISSSEMQVFGDVLGCAEQAYLRCSEERGDVAFSLYCTSAIHYGIATYKGRVNPNFGLTFASHFYSALATSIATTAVKKWH